MVVPWPFSAEKEFDCTENSWIASTEGTIEATSKYWLLTLPPSIMNTVLLLRPPLTLIAGACRDEFVPRLMAPGTRVASCVKSRPFNGRSRIFLLPMTCPTTAVSLERIGASAVTVTVSLTSPISRLMSTRAICATSSLISGRVVTLNPSLIAVNS